MSEVVIGSNIVVFGDEFDEFEQVERFANCATLRARLQDGLRVAHEVFYGVGQRAEFEFIEIGDGDEGVGLGQADQIEARQLIFFINFLFFPKDLVVTSLHLPFFLLVLRGDRQRLTRRSIEKA